MLFDGVTGGLSKLCVQTVCEHMSSAKCDKGAVYDHWQQLGAHYNPVWTMGRSKWVSYILVYTINKGHRLSWNELNAFLSPASHQSLQTHCIIPHTPRASTGSFYIAPLEEITCPVFQ